MKKIFILFILISTISSYGNKVKISNDLNVSRCNKTSYTIDNIEYYSKYKGNVRRNTFKPVDLYESGITDIEELGVPYRAGIIDKFRIEFGHDNFFTQCENIIVRIIGYNFTRKRVCKGTPPRRRCRIRNRVTDRTSKTFIWKGGRDFTRQSVQGGYIYRSVQKVSLLEAFEGAILNRFKIEIELDLNECPFPLQVKPVKDSQEYIQGGQTSPPFLKLFDSRLKSIKTEVQIQRTTSEEEFKMPRQLRIFDLNGRQIENQWINLNATEEQIKQNLAPGIYIIKSGDRTYKYSSQSTF